MDPHLAVSSFSLLTTVAVWLDKNDITGSIPTEIGLLTGLASISITNSSLTGSIPTEMGNLHALQRLWLYSNKLTGNIPAELANLDNLEVFEVHNNNIVGSMPNNICDAIDKSEYNYKSLTSDCKSEVSCDAKCCTQCF
jgi:Leucine-rich repeat (LRR) protein